MDAAHTPQLFETFHVMVHEAFRGTVRRCCAQALSAGNAADNGQLQCAFGVLGSIVEHRRGHTAETEGIGLHRSQFLFYIKRRVLPAYAAGMEVKVHAAQIAYQLQELRRRIAVGNVDPAPRNDLLVFILQLLQLRFVSSAHSHLPLARLRQLHRHFAPDARSAAHDNRCFHLSNVHILKTFLSITVIIKKSRPVNPLGIKPRTSPRKVAAIVTDEQTLIGEHAHASIR